MAKKAFILFIALIFTIPLVAQEYTSTKTTHKKALKCYDKARSYNRSEKFPDAITELNKALKRDPLFIDAKILRASVHGIMGNLVAAETEFEAVIALNEEYSPRVLYELALIEMEAQKHAEAIPHFEKYISSKAKSQRRKKKAAQHLITAQFSAEAIKNPVPFEAANLGEAINTDGLEYLPSFTADGKRLIFTARVGGQEDFFFSKKIEGKWLPRQPLGDINTPMNEGAQCISADGRLLVFTSCDSRAGRGGCDLHFSEFKNGHWTASEKIKGPINTNAWEAQPSLSADGQILYFASDRKGGIGKRDIWKSRRQKNGTWGTPENLGKTINTVDNDQCAFIHPDGETLYFCSEGWPGMGGIDLYFSRKDSSSNWQTPQNIGYPINTSANEGTLVVSIDGKTAYFASDIKTTETETEDGLPISSLRYELNNPASLNIDIYSFPLYEAARPNPVTYVKAKVVNARSKRGLKARAEIIDLSTGKVFAQTSTDEDGNFLLCLPSGRDYALHVSKEKYLFHSENFSLTDSANIEQPFLMNIDLQPIPEESVATSDTKGKAITLKNVFFESGSAALKSTSESELNRLFKLLKDNENLKIQINGHTDNVGTPSDNQTLSENRAKAVYDYLIAKKISANRLKFKGFGESEPIADNATVEGRRENRRTTFWVLGKR